MCCFREEFISSMGNLINFDGSNNPALTRVALNGEELLSIDLRNGTNENIEFFSAVQSPNLSCVLVDNAAFSAENWPNIDDSSLYTEDESTCEGLL